LEYVFGISQAFCLLIFSLLFVDSEMSNQKYCNLPNVNYFCFFNIR
jgi:hypothetical protein